MEKYLKIPQNFDIVEYINNIPFIAKKNNDQIIKIKWSWFKQAIKIESEQYSFFLFPTDIVKCSYYDVDSLILAYYDIVGMTKLPSIGQLRIILNNRDKINEILKKKKCPLIPDNATFWVNRNTCMDNTGQINPESSLRSNIHIPLFIKNSI